MTDVTTGEIAGQALSAAEEQVLRELGGPVRAG